MLIGIDARELAGRSTGTGRYLRNLLAIWSRSTADRLVAYLDAPLTSTPPIVGPGLEWRSLSEAPPRGLVWQERLLPRAVHADRVDVFFSPAYHAPLSLGRPRVTAIHDLSFFSCAHDFRFSEGLRRRLLVAAAVRVSRAILACSQFTRREIETRFPAATGRVHYVPLGADDDLRPAPARTDARRRLRVDGPLVLWVGSVFNRRCLPELIAAGALLVRTWPRLVIDVVGDNRTHPERDLPELVRQAGLAGHVRLSGFVGEGDLALRYAAADAVVQLSDYEGFGLPALEAMARGVPVVASDRPALSEIVGDAACRVDPRDPGDIARALARVLSEPEFADALVARGRAHARLFSWESAAMRTLDVLREAAHS